MPFDISIEILKKTLIRSKECIICFISENIYAAQIKRSFTNSQRLQYKVYLEYHNPLNLIKLDTCPLSSNKSAFHTTKCINFINPVFVYRQQSLQWRRNERDGVSNHRRLDCLHKPFVRAQIKGGRWKCFHLMTLSWFLNRSHAAVCLTPDKFCPNKWYTQLRKSPCFVISYHLLLLASKSVMH